MKTVFFNSHKTYFMVSVLFFFGITSNYALCSQNLVSKGLDSVKVAFNIKYEKPKSFNSLNKIQPWKLGDSSPGSFYCVFESKDGQCRLLYNVLPAYGRYSNCACLTHRDRMYREIKSTLSTDYSVPNDYLHILPPEEAQKRFNADSVFLYSIPVNLSDTNNEKFSHCTRMVIVKQNRPIVDLVWYFTEKGRKREKQYMQKINNRIWYNEGYGNYNQPQWERWMKTYFKEIMDACKD